MPATSIEANGRIQVRCKDCGRQYATPRGWLWATGGDEVTLVICPACQLQEVILTTEVTQ